MSIVDDMRELPFGARISDSFVDLLRRHIVKAYREKPGTSACLCAEEKPRDQTVSRREEQANRIDFSKDPKIAPVNRLAPSAPLPKRTIASKERIWALRFDDGKYPAEATFKIDGMQLHISRGVQADLKNATLFCVFGKIVVRYARI